MRPEIQSDYERWLGQLGDDLPLEAKCVSAGVVLRAHYLIVDYFIELGQGDELVGIGPRSRGHLLSTVDRQHVGLGTQRKWNSLFEIVATLFWGIIRSHPFHDANKRTALLVALYQLSQNKRVPAQVSQNELDQFALRVAEARLDEYPAFEGFGNDPDGEVKFIARQWKRMTREQDVRQRLITYRQLDTILHKWDARLEQSSGNHLDVVVTREESTGFLGLRRKKVDRRVLQIGFNNWGTEVPGRDIKLIRSKLDLLPENGIDSGVFYDGVDPLPALIAQYSGPLLRLADK